MLPSINFSMQPTNVSGANAVPNESRNEETSSMFLLEPLPLEFASPSRCTTSSFNRELLLEAISSFLIEPPSVHLQNQHYATPASQNSEAACQIVVSSDEEEDAEEDYDDLFMQRSNDVADESPPSSCWSTALPLTSNVLRSDGLRRSASFVLKNMKKEPIKEDEEAHSTMTARTNPPSNDMTPTNPSAVGRSWYQRYQEMIEFKEEYGHCCVPVYWPQNPQLAQWVKRQRSQFKLRTEGRHSNMIDPRIQALNQAHFIWDSHSVFWEKRLEELNKFREEHGHCRVPTRYPQNQELAVWAKSQRRQFKLFCQGDGKSHITTERIQKLVKLGFVFTPRSPKI
jgi:hypothetical protein